MRSAARKRALRSVYWSASNSGRPSGSSVRTSLSRVVELTPFLRADRHDRVERIALHRSCHQRQQPRPVRHEIGLVERQTRRRRTRRQQMQYGSSPALSSRPHRSPGQSRRRPPARPVTASFMRLLSAFRWRRWKPGVSTKMYWASASVRTPSTRSRVVWGLRDVMLTRSPTSALIRVDLPTFGRPMTATMPTRRAVSCIRPGRRS